MWLETKSYWLFLTSPFRITLNKSFYWKYWSVLSLTKYLWFLCFHLWLLGKHLRFMITWCLSGNAWTALLALFAFCYVTSVSGMPENINRVDLGNYFNWGIWEREGVKSGSWHDLLSPEHLEAGNFLGSLLLPPSTVWCRPSSSWTLLGKGSS